MDISVPDYWGFGELFPEAFYDTVMEKRGNGNDKVLFFTAWPYGI